jgi:putative phage-type endonuclease
MDKQERIDWLKERKTYIGGSDIGCFLGLSKYKTALDIYLDKTTDRIDETTNEPAYWGNVLEDVVAQEYSKVTGQKIYEPEGLIRHPEHSFLAVNIDRWVESKDGTRHILECKTASLMKAKEWGEQGTDQIPKSYLYQVAYYAAICNVDKVDIAVLIGGQEFRTYQYIKNIDLERKLVKAVCAFWNNYVVKKKAPEPSTLSNMVTLYPNSNGSSIEADSSLLKDVESLKNIKRQETLMAEEKNILETKIKSYIGENESLIKENGDVVATWRNSKSRKVLDTKKLELENLSIYQKYLTEKSGSRSFLLK